MSRISANGPRGQQAKLRGKGSSDGVFGRWNGVGRPGDAMNHANMAHTSRYGGVVMALRDARTSDAGKSLARVAE